MVLSPDTLLLIVTLAAGILAFWACLRFPDRGPQTILIAFAHLIASMLVAHVAITLVPVVVEVPRLGVYLVVFGLVLAPLTYMMLSGMWLIRSTLTAATHGMR